MSKKFDLLNSLEEDAKSPKVPYQLFEATLGFEKAEVAIPLSAADAFLAEATEVQPKSTATLKKLAVKHGGYLA